MQSLGSLHSSAAIYTQLSQGHSSVKACATTATLTENISCPWERTARGFPKPHTENGSVLLPCSGYSGQFLGFLLLLIFSEALFLALASRLNISRIPSTYQCSKSEESARWVWFVPTSVIFLKLRSYKNTKDQEKNNDKVQKV